MIRKSFFKLLLPSLLSSVNFLYSEDHHLIHKIIENQWHCVSAFDGDKIFIHPENIFSTDQGLFIDLNGSESFPLPLLQFSKNGHFIEANLECVIESLAAKKTKGPCPNCGVNTGQYGHCQNPRCEFYGLRVL
jgi:hypothetical protein